MTDQELIYRYARQGSQAAFGELIKRHSRLVYSTCKRDLGDPDLAEDCAQAVFMVLARKAHLLRIEKNLSGWLFKTARLAAKDMIRQERRRRIHEETVMNSIDAGSERDEAIWNTIAPLLHETLERQPAADRQILLMRFFDDMSFAEIGGELAITEDAARMRVRRALDKLRNTLSRHVDGGNQMSVRALESLMMTFIARDAPSLDAIHRQLSIYHLTTAAGPSAAAALAEGVLKTMWKTQVAKIFCIAAIVGLAVGTIVPIIAHNRRAIPVVTLISNNGAKSDVPPAAQTAIMSNYQNYFTAYNAKNFKECAKCFAPDYAVKSSRGSATREQFLELLKMTLQSAAKLNARGAISRWNMDGNNVAVSIESVVIMPVERPGQAKTMATVKVTEVDEWEQVNGVWLWKSSRPISETVNGKLVSTS